VSEAGGGSRGHGYSPDGRWWWDGQRWQSVPAAPSTGPGTGGPWLLVFLIVVAVAVSSSLGVGAVVIASRVGHIAPPGPPPSTPYLPDASCTGIEAAATSHGLRCGAPQGPFGFGPVPTIRVCQRRSGTEVLTVQTIGPDAGHIGVVTASVLAPRPADGQAALALLEAVVSASVAGTDAASDTAWLSAHFDQSGTSETTVDGVMLRLTVTGPQRSLIVEPAPS
jgi:hypothetical protein